MDLSNMTPKDKMMYEIAMEIKENLIRSIEKKIVLEEFEVEDALHMISRAEYKRGKADGIKEDYSRDFSRKRREKNKLK